MSKEIKKSRIPKLRFPKFRDAGKWEEVKLRDLGTFRGGVTSIKKEDYGFGTPFITYMNVFRNSKVNLDDLTLMNVPEKDLKRFECKYGDILFTASSETEDEVAMSSVLLKEIKNLTFNGFSKRFRLNNFETLTPIFARYLLRSNNFRNSVRRLVTGNIRFNIGQENLRNIQVVLPSPLEQTAIANCLSSVDELITAQTQKIDVLKAHKKGLMQKLFPAEDETVPKLRFPQFRDAEEWEEMRLGDMVIFQRGYDLPKKEMRGGDIPVAGSNGIIGFHDSATTNSPGITIGRSGSIGKPKFYRDNFWAHNTTLYVKEFYGNSEKFVFYLLQTLDLGGFNSGSAVPTLNRNYIHELDISLPPLSEQKAIADCLSSVDELITVQTQKIDALKAHKKGLMQKLFPSP